MNEEEHRALGIELFNKCWEYLDKGDVVGDDQAVVLTTAFASKFHWSFSGGPEQWAISDWMVSRVACAIDEGELAVRFARRAFDATGTFEPPDWLMASLAEGMARAYAANGEHGERDEWLATAERLLSAIADEEDRELIASQLNTVPR